MYILIIRGRFGLRRYAWIGLALLFSTATYCIIAGVPEFAPQVVESSQITIRGTGYQSAYTNRGPIFIDSDSDFSSYGFPGTGDENTPYRIEGYNITDSNFELIVIENTEAFFVIQDNYLDSIIGSLDAIYIRNAKNGQIFNNNIVNNRHGIFLDSDCQEIEIANNKIWDSSESGIRVNSSGSVRVYHNEVYHNTYNGIWANSSIGLEIWNNTIYDDELGIWLRNTNNSDVIGNTLFGNDNAMWISNHSSSNEINFNRIFDPDDLNPNTCGIHISHLAYDNNILNNTISNCTEHGFYAELNSGNNTIKWNTFIGNNMGGTSQAFDGASENVLYNYWSDWTTPDDDFDNIVDIPYLLEGAVMNNDPYPLTHPANPPEFHYLTPVTLLHPNGGEAITDSVVVEWSTCYDSRDHPVNYSIYYSHNSGADWTKIAGNITSTQYEWDTSSELKTTHYLVRVIAKCSEGLSVSDESDGEFSLIAHILTEPTITSPDNSGPFETSLNIQWDVAVDSWGYSVSYSLHYSSNGGSSWSDITFGLTGNSYQWDIEELANGDNYVVKVIASADGGVTSEAISVTFSIQHTTTSTTPTTPTTAPVIDTGLIGFASGGIAVIAAVVILVILFKKRSTGET
ncbi:MAG: hypothetical protein AM326_05885 [Candidatus Thorarchaeota archaeon SMTZ-45]|nr:MAG: hypothetical protein AM326_05885 [Candidatus Thorarchaeota archaeon SMTZ-45]